MAELPAGKYLIGSSKVSKVHTAQRGQMVIASEFQSTVYDVEPAGRGVYKFLSPDEDLVWTLNSYGGEQLHVEIDDGSLAQQFKLEPVTDKDDTYYISVETMYSRGTAFLGIAPYTIPMYPPIFLIIGYPKDKKEKAEQWKFSKVF